MENPTNVIEIPAFIHRRAVKKIIFGELGISIQDRFSFDRKLFVSSEDISAFRFGIKGIRFFNFTFCRKYFIEIKDYQDKVFRINLNSFYNIKSRSFFKVWAQLLEHFWNFYMVNQLNFYTELFDLKQTFELSGVTFHEDGITWEGSNKIKWNQIILGNYKTHFVIQHINDPKQSKSCVFSQNWNAVVLQALLKDIVKRPVKARKPSWL